MSCSLSPPPPRPGPRPPPRNTPRLTAASTTNNVQGTLNLIAAARQKGGVKHFILVSSIGADDLLNPLNLFWGVLFW